MPRETTVALLTDVHYADVEARGNRFYRESLTKMAEAATVLGRRRPALAVHLGDLVDSPPTPDPKREEGYLRAINAAFRKIARRRAYVLGNHCVGALTKGQYLSIVGQKKSYFSFRLGGWRVIFLDACFKKTGEAYAPGNFRWDDTEIPAPERAWLEAELNKGSYPTLVCVHQRLDLDPPSPYAVASSAAVRRILEASGQVRLVLQGHSHANELETVGAIPYATLAALVEGSGAASSGYSLLTLRPDGGFALEGFRRHGEHPLCQKAV